MEKYKVDSSNITAIEYDPANNSLFITFRGGSVYHYLDVPHVTVLRFAVAESAGKFFHQHIKNQYKAHRIK